MRILHTVQGFPSEFCAGTELYCQALSQALQERGHRCFVLAGSCQQTLSPALLTTEEAGIYVARYVSPIAPRWRDQQIDSYNPEAEALLLQYAETIHPDIIHVHHWHMLTNTIVSVAAALGIPTVVTLHDLWTSCARIHRQHRLGHFCQEPPTPSLCASCVERLPWQENGEIERAIVLRQKQIDKELRLARLLLVPSEDHQQMLSSLTGISLDRLRVVPHGSLSRLTPRLGAPASQFPQRPLRLAYWGHLVQHKGVHLLLEAVQHLQNSSAVEVFLIGHAPDADYAARLQELATGLSVTFLGKYQPPDLARLDVDLAVFPSLAYESYGFVLNEALQLGLPAIVSDRGALAARAGNAGLVFAAGDSRALADRIQEILDTPALIERMRDHIATVLPSSMEDHAQVIEAIYEEARSADAHPATETLPLASRRLAAFYIRLAARDQEIQGLKNTVQHQEAVLQQRETLLAQQGEELRQKEAAFHQQHAEELQRHAEELQRHAEELHQQHAEELQRHAEELRQKEAEFHQHKEELTHLEQRLQEEAVKVQALEGWIHKISRSIGWRVLSRLYYMREQLIAPPGTRRGRVYDLLKRTGAAYADGGLAQAVTKAREQLDSAAAPDPYQLWQARHALTPERTRQFRTEVQTLAYRPIISIVMPVYNTNETWLRRAIESVSNQIYPHWELCICDDGSTKSHLRGLLDAFCQQESRIKVHVSTRNEGISAASNHALDLATGEWVGLLDHDDELSPEALFEVARFLNANPEADIVYSDEDKIGPQGQRCQPFFKPDWSPDMLLSFMYTCHFSVYRRELLSAVGGFDATYDGSQDYDLALRLTEQARVIGHIPKVLYHWRIAPGSVAENASNKSYAYEAGKSALAAALQRRKISGTVEDTFGKQERLGFYRVKRTHDKTPFVSIIIPTRDKVHLLTRCIASIEQYTNYENYEIMIVDNDSKEADSLAYLRQTPHRVLTYREAFHFSKMMNFAAEKASGEMLLFLNNDTEVLNAEWLSAMVEHALRPEVGAVGAKLLYPNHTIQHAGVILGLCEFAGHAHRHLSGFQHGYWGNVDIIRNYSAVTAACVLMRKEVFFASGGFDEAFQYAYQDVDLCLRLREKGLLIVYTPHAQLVHHESASRGGKMAFGEQDISLARTRWHRYLAQGDPYYNPNLTKLREDFSLSVEGE